MNVVDLVIIVYFKINNVILFYQVHGALEMFGLLILALELGIRMKWLGWRAYFKHIRTMIKVSL